MFKPLKLIIHKLEKKSDKTEPQWFKSSIVANVNPTDYASLEKMVKSFSVEGVFSGSFGDPNDYDFVKSFKDYVFNGQGENQFIQFTKDVTDYLLPLLKKKGGSRGGYYVFIEYERDTQRYLGVFLIRETEGRTFRLDLHSHSLQLEPSSGMDMANMAMGCQIDYLAHRSAGVQCLTFTIRKQKDISEYFMDWVGCVERKSSRASTEDFLRLVKAIPHLLPLDSATGKQMRPGQFIDEVNSLTKGTKTKEVDLQHIGQHYFADKMFLIDQAEKHNISIDTIFNYNQNSIKKDIIVEVKDEELKLNLRFANYRFGDMQPIRVVGTAPNRMLIIESEQLIQEILKKTDTSANG